VFRVGPDFGSGLFELLIVGVLIAQRLRRAWPYALNGTKSTRCEFGLGRDDDR
jgi:hypothetical protein